MPVVNIGEMGVRMANRQMHVRVRMRLVAGIRKVVLVLVVRIMAMPVRVLEQLVGVLMHMPLAHVQPDAERHQQGGRAESQVRQRRPDGKRQQHAKVGARRWFARIMLSWGAVTVALGFTHSAAMLYILRFLLGVCEAGFYPGVLYYLTLWFPARIRARLVGYFMIGSALANAIAAPIGGVLLDFDGLLGLRGWQWVFVVTGMAAVLMSAVVWRRLPETPANA